jgi:hypothetical protein
VPDTRFWTGRREALLDAFERPIDCIEYFLCCQIGHDVAFSIIAQRTVWWIVNTPFDRRSAINVRPASALS